MEVRATLGPTILYQPYAQIPFESPSLLVFGHVFCIYLVCPRLLKLGIQVTLGPTILFQPYAPQFPLTPLVC